MSSAENTAKGIELNFSEQQSSRLLFMDFVAHLGIWPVGQEAEQVKNV